MLTSTAGIRINPKIDIASAHQAYQRDGFVQVPDLFEPDVAETLTQLVETLTYDLVMQGEDGRPLRLTMAQLQAQRQGLKQKLDQLMTRTGNGYGFLYQVYPLISAYLEGRDPGHPIHHLTEWLNGDFIALGAAITGQPQVAKADGQVTRYQAGDFIGLHNDGSQDQDTRLTAYTLGLTRRWRSDWGGQLLFHDDRGDVARGYVPRFNTLTLFKVPVLHSVAPVAPYAQARRHSVVGWLRTHDPAK